jgi:hypothetical protein
MSLCAFASIQYLPVPVMTARHSPASSARTLVSRPSHSPCGRKRSLRDHTRQAQRVWIDSPKAVFALARQQCIEAQHPSSIARRLSRAGASNCVVQARREMGGHHECDCDIRSEEDQNKDEQGGRKVARVHPTAWQTTNASSAAHHYAGK